MGELQLYAMWEKYGYESDEDEEEDIPPKPRRTKDGAKIANEFKDILETI